MRENRILRGNSRTARERQVQSASQAKAVNACDHWLSAARNYRQHLLPVPRKLESLRALKFREFRDVGADRERPLAASDDRPSKLNCFGQPGHLVDQRGDYSAF
jgi:hypothetical protein